MVVVRIDKGRQAIGKFLESISLDSFGHGFGLLNLTSESGGDSGLLVIHGVFSSVSLIESRVTHSNHFVRFLRAFSLVTHKVAMISLPNHNEIILRYQLLNGHPHPERSIVPFPSCYWSLGSFLSPFTFSPTLLDFR